MVTIRTTTFIDAPLERCFKLALSIDLNRAATRKLAVDGITSGLIGPGETVTWKSRSFPWSFHHRNQIEVWRPYSYFREIMVEGPLKAFEHERHFASWNDGTRVRDEIRFTAPFGLFGKLSERLYIRRRIMRRLHQHNKFIRQVAESDQWHEFLDRQPELDTRLYQSRSATVSGQRRIYAE